MWMHHHSMPMPIRCLLPLLSWLQTDCCHFVVQYESDNKNDVCSSICHQLMKRGQVYRIRSVANMARRLLLRGYIECTKMNEWQFKHICKTKTFKQRRVTKDLNNREGTIQIHQQINYKIHTVWNICLKWIQINRTNLISNTRYKIKMSYR